jgi:hypothetical protein
MKWTKELDNKLIELINEGKKHIEISNILQTTEKSVSNRCNRLKLKIVTTKEHNCKNCENVFISYIKEERQFCSKSCSVSFSNKNRKLSQETKKKISKTLSNKNRKLSQETKKKISKKLSNKNIKQKLINNKKIVRNCRFCNLPKINKKHKIICEDCRMEYYKFYRPSCEFIFNINKLKYKFDMNLVEKYGWYSPLNKRNNLNGISKDHMYSVRDGFINKIDPKIIKHPANCKLLIHTDNNRKNFNSTISFDELIDRIENW